VADRPEVAESAYLTGRAVAAAAWPLDRTVPGQVAPAEAELPRELTRRVRVDERERGRRRDVAADRRPVRGPDGRRGPAGVASAAGPGREVGLRAAAGSVEPAAVLRRARSPACSPPAPRDAPRRCQGREVGARGPAAQVRRLVPADQPGGWYRWRPQPGERRAGRSAARGAVLPKEEVRTAWRGLRRRQRVRAGSAAGPAPAGGPPARGPRSWALRLPAWRGRAPDPERPRSERALPIAPAPRPAPRAARRGADPPDQPSCGRGRPARPRWTTSGSSPRCRAKCRGPGLPCW
jgi:hypothetical protein